ncbi:MAG: hypothetical protein U0794_14500 [Isosphaeraceae bacterium]
MRRVAAGLSLAFVTVLTGNTRADDGPPPLTPPVLTPSTTAPAPAPVSVPEALPAPTAKPVAPPSAGSAKPTTTTPPRVEPQPILVIPGVTTPGANRVRPSSPSGSTGRIPSSAPLVGPAETGPMNAIAPPADIRLQPPTSADTPRTPLGSGIDAVPSSPSELRLELEPGELPTRSSSPDAPVLRSPLPDRTTRPTRPQPSPNAPRRPQGLLGRMFPPPPPEDKGLDDRDRVTVQPRTDPATDAAMKRRIEREIQTTLGNRVRSYQVRVVGKDVVVRAQSARFWQRRIVRNAIEGLPSLNGYKATILVDE